MTATVTTIAQGPAAAAPTKAGGPNIAAVTTVPITPFGLLSTANSKYVTAEDAGNAPLSANRTQFAGWEQFTLIQNPNGFFSLKAAVNGKFVTAENGGAGPLIANRTAIGPWEEFALLDNGDGTVSLWAHANGRYVTATGTNNAGPLIANSVTNGAADTRFYEAGIPVESILTAQSNNNNVTVNATTQQLTANSGGNVGPAEQLALYDAGNGVYALRSRSTGLFVAADNAGNGPLVANRAAIGLWEMFALVDNGDGTVSLRALVNNLYVSTTGINNGGPMIANSTTVTAGPNSPQRFSLNIVPSPQDSFMRSNATGGFVTAAAAPAPLLANGAATTGALRVRFAFGTGGTVVLSDNSGAPITGVPITGNGFQLQRGAGGVTLTFTLVNNIDGTISLLCRQNGRYVTLASLTTSNANVVASASTLVPETKFALINQG
jgi:hypothetical protein